MLERRAQMPPGSAAEQQQKAQIPKDLEDLRLALAAAKETQGTGARPVLTQQGQGGALTKPGADALQTPYGGATPYTNGNGSGVDAKISRLLYVDVYSSNLLTKFIRSSNWKSRSDEQ